MRIDLDETQPTAFVTQTTLATDEVAGVIDALEQRFGDLARPAASDICYASQNRQEAVREIAPDCDLVLVVGSRNSSNSNRLVEVAGAVGQPPIWSTTSPSCAFRGWPGPAHRRHRRRQRA